MLKNYENSPPATHEVRDYSRAEVEKIIEEKDMTMSEFLKGFQDEGYLLHGSPSDNVQEFEPKVPGDLSGGWTSQKGVYATSDVQPIFFAVIHRYMVPESCYTEMSRTSNDVTYKVSKNIIDYDAVQPGWVYIFDKEGFSPNPSGSGEWINPNHVKPLGKIPVDPKDLEHPIEIVESSRD
jgi:hypothetical protein